MVYRTPTEKRFQAEFQKNLNIDDDLIDGYAKTALQACEHPTPYEQLSFFIDTLLPENDISGFLDPETDRSHIFAIKEFANFMALQIPVACVDLGISDPEEKEKKIFGDVVSFINVMQSRDYDPYQGARTSMIAGFVKSEKEHDKKSAFLHNVQNVTMQSTGTLPEIAHLYDRWQNSVRNH